MSRGFVTVGNVQGHYLVGIEPVIVKIWERGGEGRVVVNLAVSHQVVLVGVPFWLTQSAGAEIAEVLASSRTKITHPVAPGPPVI